MVKTSWIYSLKKEELVAYLVKFDVNAEGTVEQLRKRFISFCHKATEEEQKCLDELIDKHPVNPSTSVAGNTATNGDQSDDEDNEYSIAEGYEVLPVLHKAIKGKHVPKNSEFNSSDPVGEFQLDDKMNISAIDKIRKWLVRYDGGKGALSFTERIEELADAYNISIDLLPRTMPELLKDKALTWYRNNNRRWKSWDQFKIDFLAFFLPARYFENLEDTIRQRLQETRESFRDYVLALQELMRHSTYTDEQKLHRIYRNCRQEYQLHIKRKEFTRLDELMLLAGDYEEIKHVNKPEINTNTRPRMERSRLYQTDNNEAPKQQTHINAINACRRCGQRGHFARACRNPQKMFCWTCRKLNTRTIDCCNTNPGNAVRTHAGRGPVSQENLTPHTQ